uniref:Uncharacterized protein n=1 Tax=Chenopodium quinoa TaxID=63459 RepID=A0A803N8P8_CHEQI
MKNYLYRNNGNGESVEVDENTFRDKYILVCCFHIPIFRAGTDSRVLRDLLMTFSELYSTREDVEIVVVAKMDKLMTNFELLSDRFLLGFPSSCLVVPFKDSKRRDYICYYLHLRDHRRMQCLLLDNKGKERDILFSGYPIFAIDHGADAVPFTNEKLEELDADDLPEWETASTFQLEGLFGVHSL